jgi:phosphatidylinositol-4,5-bisphosphate 3-kinase
MAIEWDDPEEVREAHNMIKIWTPLPPEDALPLLDAPFADELLRLYAVERVSIFSDDELALYMLELTQGLIFEKNLFNPLAEMLLERSLHNLWVVGHELFWLLRSQLHLKPTYERYALMLE